MFLYLKIFVESVAQAWHQLVANRLRSLLSLLGITIGIFCIIGVQSSVDSMQDNIKGSLKKLGDDVIYIQKFPWTEDPGANFWKYMRRPDPDLDDYKAIRTHVKSAGLMDYHIFVGQRSLKYRSNAVEGAYLVSVMYDCADLFNVEFEKGRWYTNTEYEFGMNKIVIGHTIAEELFQNIDPIGKEVKIAGNKMEVIGVIKESGKDILTVLNFDEVILAGNPTAKKMGEVSNQHRGGGSIMVKVKEGYAVDELKDDLVMRIRAERRIRPKENDNFSLNELSIISNALDQVFGVFDLVGLAIGIFAILVGCFSVANIMFVSVKERTNIIGIKKAMGAKRFMILLEFLIESIVLCFFGGLIGLLLVYGVTKGLSNFLPFPIYLSYQNIISGLAWSIGIGVIAGLLPALSASKMNPVDAIRA